MDGKIVFDATQFILIGALVSVIVSLMKRYITSDSGRILAAVVVSLLAAGIYVWLKDSNYWHTFLLVLTFAGAIYTYIIRQFEKTEAGQRMLGVRPKLR